MEPGSLAIITPPLDCTSFEAGGVTYTCTDTLTVGRGAMLRRFRTEMQFNMTLPAVQRVLVEMRNFLKAANHYDSCTLLEKLIDGSNLLGSNRVREAELVALFFNAPDEDPASYSPEAIKHKVEVAWRAVSDDFFTRKAVLLLLHISKAYPSLQEVAASSALPVSDLPPN